MYLLAVSGGPDSMFLLNEFKHKAIIVAHVNYKKREDSDIDEKHVRNFCEKNGIIYHIFNAGKTIIKSNFQDAARKIRYKFFKEIYDKYNCDRLIIGHHMDDWLETAIMQEESGREPLYYGIRYKNKVDGMMVFRPFIQTYWKSDIEKKCKKLGIGYATDATNLKPIYERNKVRMRLMEMPLIKKEELYKKYLKLNKMLEKKLKQVISWYQAWEKEGFKTKDLKEIPKDYRNKIIFEMIYQNFKTAKLSTKKMNSIQDFIFGKDGGKEYIIDKDRKIAKNKGTLSFIEKIEENTETNE